MRALALCVFTFVSASAYADDAFEPNDTCQTAWPLAAGSYPGLEVSPASHDYFRVTVPAHETLRVLVTPHSSAPLIKLLLDGSTCNTMSFHWSNVWTNDSSAAVDVVVFVFEYLGTTTATYDLDISVEADPCLSLPDDVLEPNDDCDEAPYLGPGSYPNLRVRAHDRDLFLVMVPPGETVVARADYPSTQYDLRLWHRFPDCGESAGWGIGDSFPGYELLTWTNATASPEVFRLEVDPEDPCVPYDLTISLDPDPCLTAPDDGFEPNDAPGTAAQVTPGTYTGLFSVTGNEDWFRLNVPVGATLHAQIFFQHADADLDMRLVAMGGTQDTSDTNTDIESVRWTNTGPIAVDAFIEVDQDWIPTYACATYDLVLSLESGPHVGTAFCPGDVNSTGAPSALVGTGSTSIAANDFGLKSIRVPANQLSSYAYGLVTDVIDLGGHDLCVGAPLFRSPVTSSGAAGIVTWTIDNANQPIVVQGATVYFQTWYRDPTATPTYNLSNALAVVFTE